MDEKNLKHLAVPLAILILAVLAFFVLKPIFVPVILGLLFAYIFYPLYSKLYSKLKSKNWSAILIVLISLFLFLIPTMLIIYASIKQILEVYIIFKNMDLDTLLRGAFPSLFSNPVVASEITSTLSHLSSQLTDIILSFFKNTIMNLASIIMGVLILLFTFFFALIEGDNVRNYLSTIFPFPKEYSEKLSLKFDQVTSSFIYGHLIVGLAQGIIAGLGYFILGIPNAFLLTILTTFVGVLPLVGPALIWIPITIYLFINGNNVVGIQLLIYGLFVLNWVDAILRPRIMSKKAEMNPAIALIGVIGGLYAFGFIGLILGPLILAYLILLIELYKDKKTESILIRETPEVNA